MPTYEYECRACLERFEKKQSFSDEAIKVCPSCGGETRRVLHPPAIVFKGSGWYITDSRPAPPSEGSSGESSTPAEKSDAKAPVADKKSDAAAAASTKSESGKASESKGGSGDSSGSKSLNGPSAGAATSKGSSSSASSSSTGSSTSGSKSGG